MRRAVIGLALTLAACGSPAAVPSPTPSAVETPLPAISAQATPSPTLNPVSKGKIFVQVPMPTVALQPGTPTIAAPPPLKRAQASDLTAVGLDAWAKQFFDRLDTFRGGGAYPRTGPVQDVEWNIVVWPGPFQKIVRAAVAAKPGQGRAFVVDTVRLDAGYLLPWGRLQFIDATVAFRDQARSSPAEGELSYLWHVRLPTSPLGGAFAVADGYDASAPTWMSAEPYWSVAALEKEATSAIAGYLWSESYVPGGDVQYPNLRNSDTKFWKSRIEAINGLNGLFDRGVLSERRFDGITTKIDSFDVMTYFGGGIVTVTIAGTLVEVTNGKTVSEKFTAPLKFFRFGNSPTVLSGWMAVDAQENGAWIMGSDLALDKLQTSFG